MKKKIFLVTLVIILTITNFILFKNYYDTNINNNNKITQNTNCKN